MTCLRKQKKCVLLLWKNIDEVGRPMFEKMKERSRQRQRLKTKTQGDGSVVFEMFFYLIRICCKKNEKGELKWETKNMK